MTTQVFVAHVIGRMNLGGPAVEIVELMRGIESTEVRQVLLTGWCAPDEPDYLIQVAPDVQSTRIDGFGRNIRASDDLKAFFSLMKWMRAHRPDVVHTHTFKAGLLGRLAVKFSRIDAAIIHTYHGHLLYGYGGRLQTQIYVQVERLLAKYTDRIVAVGNQVRTELIAAGIANPSTSSVIYSGIEIRARSTRQLMRAALGIPEDRFLVGMVGRLTRIKRPDRFLEVVRLAKTQGKEISFLVAGGGDLEESVREQVQREALPVEVLGWRLDSDDIISACDVLLLTSDNEGIPISLIQAGMQGLPTVATNVGSVQEVIIPNVTGIVCERSPEELLRALDRLAVSMDRRQMGAQARAYVGARFNLSSFLQQHASLYLELARKRDDT